MKNTGIVSIKGPAKKRNVLIKTFILLKGSGLKFRASDTICALFSFDRSRTIYHKVKRCMVFIWEISLLKDLNMKNCRNIIIIEVKSVINNIFAFPLNIII